MRIGFDIRVLQTQGASATRGIGHYTTDLLEGLLTFCPNDRLVLFGMAGRPVPHGWSDRCEIVEVGGEAIHELDKPWYIELPKIRSTQSLIDAWKRRVVSVHSAAFARAVNRAKVDVVHLPVALDAGVYVERRLRPPTVATFLDAIPLEHREDFYDIWSEFTRRMYDRQLRNLRSMSRLVAISGASREAAIRFAGVDPKRVDVVYPAIPPAFTEPLDPVEVARARTRLGLTDPFVLFCSALDPHKNAERVVAAFSQVRPELPPGTKLAFIAPAGHQHLLDAMAEEARLDIEVIVLTGRICDEEVVALFQSALCLTSPSLIEGFGLPAAQALAAGIPAIVSNFGSLAEIVGDAGLQVDPESVESIGAAMVQASNDEPLRRELIARGLRRAPVFSPERQATQVRTIYDEVAVRKRSTIA